MKKTLIVIIILFLIQYIVYAGTYTTNYSLYKPERGEVDWEDALSADFDTIDRTMYNLSQDTDGLSTDVEQVRDYAEELSGDVEALRTYAENLSGDVEGLSRDVEQVRDYAEGLSPDVENVRQILESLSDDVGLIDAYATGLSSDVEQVRDYTEGLSTDVENVRGIAEANAVTATGLSTDVEQIRDYTEGLSPDVENVRDIAETINSTTGLSGDVENARIITETLSSEVGSVYYRQGEKISSVDISVLSADVISGDIDMGAANSLELPNSANPRVSADGEIAWNTEDNALIVYDGVDPRMITTSQDVDILVFAPDSVNDEVAVFHIDPEIYPNGITIANVQMMLPSTAAYKLPIEEWSGTAPITAPVISRDVATLSTDSDEFYKEAVGASLDTEELAADNYIYLNIPSTDVDYIHVKVIFWVKEG